MLWSYPSKKNTSISVLFVQFVHHHISVQVDKVTSDLERNRDLTHAIVHVDMDAFYAAVEMRDCPELKDKPMAVGSMSMLVSKILSGI